MINNFDALTKRIEILEQSNRRLRLWGIAAALVIAVLVLIGADKTPRTLEAQKIVLLDNHGKTKLTISTPAVAGASVDIKPDDPVIWLTDSNGADRAMLSIDGLFFADSKSRPTVSLSTDPKGLSRLRLYGKDGKVSWSAP
jgi:hypothetical protein